MKKFEKYYGWIVAFIFCVAVIAVYKTFDNLSNITKYIGVIIDAIKPFISAFIIAYILNIPAKKLQKLLKKTKNQWITQHSVGISIFLIYVIAILILLFVLRMLIPAISKNILDLYNNSSHYIASFQNFINNFEIAKKLNLSELDLNKTIMNFFESLGMLRVEMYVDGVFNVTTGILNTFIALIASVYMLLDKERLQKVIVRVMGIFFKDDRVESITLHTKRVNDIFVNYIYSRLMCSIIMAVVSSVVLSVMNVKYALILGIFVGSMDMIPYFGSIIASVITIAVCLITGGFWKGVWVAVALCILQQIDGNLIGPKIMSDSLEIRPLWIIFAVSVGGSLFGFFGMLLSVPVVAIIKAIASDYLSVKEEKKKTVKVSEENE